MTKKEFWSIRPGPDEPERSLEEALDSSPFDGELRKLQAFRDALGRGEISFWLQPQCRMPDRKIVGAEALARWQRPDGTIVPPDEFVPLLEKYGVVNRLDTYIWESVCQWQRSWLDRGHTAVPVSVNVSRIDIFSMDVPAFFAGLLKKYDLPPRYIKLEITESAYVDDADRVRDAVEELRRMELMVLMDDFGSGYSSLNMLRSIQVDVIKLDARFLRLQDADQRKGVNILESVFSMTRSLSLPIIVEGVETREQVIFLADLGCRYMQGYFFYRPMPLAQFETLIGDGKTIDTNGFIFKSNRQLRVRELFGGDIISDAMLNNILGPVAFYRWHGEDVDIVRYNQQFYRLVGIEVDEMNVRRWRIQNFLPPEDREKLYDLLRRAEEQRINGAKGVVRSFRPNGALVWLALSIYYIDETAEGKEYYVSATDVSEQQFVSSALPGGYYRCMTEEDEFEFLFVSQNFLDLLDLEEKDIRDNFDNKLLNLIHPADRERVRTDSRAMARGEGGGIRHYRLRRRNGDYIYVAENGHLTDHYGAVCWQCVVIDVSEMMRSREQQRVMSDYFTDSVLFLRQEEGQYNYEVAIHGLGKRMGITAERFGQLLNSGEFCRWIEGHRDIPHSEYTRQFITALAGGEHELKVTLPDGRRLRLLARADEVRDDSPITHIVILHGLD